MFLALGFLGPEELLAGSKRALDEDILQIFRGGQQCVVLHNTCEDSLLASPLYFVLANTTELQGIEVSTDGGETFGPTRHVLSILSYLLKAPVVLQGIQDLLRALVGFPAETTCCLSEYFVCSLVWDLDVCNGVASHVLSTFPHHKRPESLSRVVGE